MDKELELMQLELELKYEREKLENEKKQFKCKVISEERRIEQKRQLFDTQMRLLQKEAIHLSQEWDRLKWEETLIENKINNEPKIKVIEKSEFFAGVKDILTLKKRYRDLMKIYHPDNISGDNNAMKDIVKEYERLRENY